MHAEATTLTFRKRRWICAQDDLEFRLHPKRFLARRVQTVFNQIENRHEYFNF